MILQNSKDNMQNFLIGGPLFQEIIPQSGGKLHLFWLHPLLVPKINIFLYQSNEVLLKIVKDGFFDLYIGGLRPSLGKTIVLIVLYIGYDCIF